MLLRWFFRKFTRSVDSIKGDFFIVLILNAGIEVIGVQQSQRDSVLKNTETAMVAEADNIVHASGLFTLLLLFMLLLLFTLRALLTLILLFTLVAIRGNVVVHAESIAHVYNIVHDGVAEVHIKEIVHNDVVFTFRALIMLNVVHADVIHYDC